MNHLPVDDILPELRTALAHGRNAVLMADPGAGKTTRVPPGLLDEPWLAGKKLIMLEPRRLAAQRAAAYMARQRGEDPGGMIGFRIRGEQRIGPTTRIEVVTEGILTRLLQHDPALEGTGLVIFDEFHERSIHADLGLALALNVQEHLRPDLRILVMSATLEGLPLQSLLGDAAVVKSEGRTFPVSTQYLQQEHDGPIEPLVVSAVLKALRNEEGDLLVFLPGRREIRTAEMLLLDEDLPQAVAVRTLYGDAPPEQQRAALEPSPKGERKIILSTAVAETSLTIDGVRVVVDSGFARGPRFDPRRGMTGLVTSRVSRASADQRRGRAGRQQPGVCYRLWTERQQQLLPAFAPPEILAADLAPLALELARWGTPSGEGLCFLDPPPAAHLAQARALLTSLGAIGEDGKLTSRGRELSEIPVHPRLAHMLLRGKEIGLGVLACDIAALLEERDLLRSDRDADVDLHSRWHELRVQRGGDRLARDRARTQAKRLRTILGLDDKPPSPEGLGLLLALAYPDRVARQREPRSDRYQLANGTGGILPRKSLLSRHEFLAVGDVDGAGAEVRLMLAEPVEEEELRQGFEGRLETSEEVRWDDREEAVIARQVTRLGAIELSAKPLPASSPAIVSTMLEGIRTMGFNAIPWDKESTAFRMRSEWLRIHCATGGSWPDLSEQYLMETLDRWLGPFVEGITRRTHLRRLDTLAILQAQFAHHQLRDLDRLAPGQVVVPSGSRVTLDYSAGAHPVLAVQLQEMFGQTTTPTVAGGRITVLLHLLSPARRPLAVTQDLPSFWKNAYQEVRKAMRARYPKHHWPEDPLAAQPTRRTRRKGTR